MKDMQTKSKLRRHDVADRRRRRQRTLMVMIDGEWVRRAPYRWGQKSRPFKPPFRSLMDWPS